MVFTEISIFMFFFCGKTDTNERAYIHQYATTTSKCSANISTNSVDRSRLKPPDDRFSSATIDTQQHTNTPGTKTGKLTRYLF